MTRNDLPTIRARNAVRTPGEWDADDPHDACCGSACTPDGCHETHPSGRGRLDGPIGADGRLYCDAEGDAVFIAAAVDVPALCDEVEALRAVADATLAARRARAAVRRAVDRRLAADAPPVDDARWAADMATHDAATAAESVLADALRAAGYEVVA